MLWQRLLDLLYPPRCVACQQRGYLFCSGCAAACRPRRLSGWSRSSSPSLAGIAGLYAFVPPLRGAIHALKYEGLKDLSAPLAALMHAHAGSTRLLCGDAALAWVPLHGERLRERGFNQAELLTRQLATLSSLPLAPGLARIRATAPQVGQEAQSRRLNLRGAFCWQSADRPPPRIIVVDDVLTTGSTLSACAEALRAAGAQQVFGLALAFAGEPRAAHVACTASPAP